MQSLPSPPEHVFIKFDQLIRSFIWNNKKSKISLSRLQNNNEAGGLKLLELKLRDRSLKFSNFLGYIDTDSICNDAIEQVIKTSGKEFMHCNLSTKDLTKLKSGIVS